MIAFKENTKAGLRPHKKVKQVCISCLEEKTHPRKIGIPLTNHKCQTAAAGDMHQDKQKDHTRAQPVPERSEHNL